MQLFWFELSALVLLISVFVWRLWQRTKQFAQHERVLPQGHGFDTTPVQTRLKKVRQDYAVAAAERARRTPNHDLIVMAVRRSLKKLSYFRSVDPGKNETVEHEVTPGDK